MSVFFFVVGLELKNVRLLVGNYQTHEKLLPIVAAVGGMVMPAVIFLLLNPSGEMHKVFFRNTIKTYR